MALPPRVFYTLTEAAARWGCSPSDIVGWASIGTIEIVTGLAPSYLGGRQIAGLVTVAGAGISGSRSLGSCLGSRTSISRCSGKSSARINAINAPLKECALG